MTGPILIYRRASFAGQSLDNRVVRRSQNLRAIQRHNRDHAVFRVNIRRDSDNGGVLYVEWTNGDWTRVSFASYTVLKLYMSNRLRTWDLDRTAHWPDSQDFSIPAGSGQARHAP